MVATWLLIEEAQAAEARRRDVEAITAYRRITSAEPRLRAWTELSIARLQGREPQERDWDRLEGLTPTGLPVLLLVSALIEARPEEERQRLPPLLRRALVSLRAGRWWLSYEERRFHDAQLRRALSGTGAPVPEDSELEELVLIQGLVRRSPPSRRDVASRSYERAGMRAFLFLWSPAAAGEWTGAAVSERNLAAVLEAALKPLLAGQPFAAAIWDAQGHAVWQGPEKLAGAWQRSALRAVPGWEMVFGRPVEAGWGAQRRLVWSGLIALLVLMLAAGLAMTVRVVRREVELGRLQSEFVGAVTHEFKSPLTSIHLLVERIAGGRFRSPAETGEYCAAITRETARLERLVNRILESQQIEAGRREYSFAPASLSEIAAGAVERMRPLAEAAGVGLVLETEGQAPDAELDQAAIADALENLLDNAIKYSPCGGRVSVSVRRVGEEAQVEVCDQGIGIEPADLPHIFDRFYRGRRGEGRNVHGTGLGLALVKAAVYAHRGKVEVASAPGAGSRFRLRLPVFQARSKTWPAS